MKRDERRVAVAWVGSVGVHVGGLVAFGVFALGTFSGEAQHVPFARTFPIVESVVEIEVAPRGSDDAATAETHAPDLPAPAPRGGGEAPPRPDTGKAGRGGTRTADVAATNLADRDEQLDLTREVLSRLDRSQIQRIRSSTRRSSREDWRASREPMELTFLASGEGADGVPERRTPAAGSPSSGARESGNPARVGTALGGAERPVGWGEVAYDVGSSAPGAERASAGLGVRAAAPGYDHRDSAKVPLARPMVPESTPSIPAERRGKPRDNVDSEQDVASAIQSLVHASAAGGAPGRGPGGQDGAGPTGSGGKVGAGSRSSALGTGAGPGLDVDPRDRRRMLYLRQVMAKVNPLWAFPKAAALEGKQGTVIVGFTIRGDGSVAGLRVTRSSNIAAFDESCRSAVARAGPFPPLPPELGASLPISMPFDARNPAVRPRGAGAKTSPGNE